ncbi:hypothetical protein ACS0TY_024053 [Phlomoides rotata]
MAEMKGKNKRLPINLSFLALTDSKKQISACKSPRNFEEPNGVVGLGILADRDLIFNNGCRNAVMSPKSASNPIPILKNKNSPQKFSEEYTCVISHVGKNLIKKREYFEADILGKGNNNGPPVSETNFLSSCFLCEKMLHGLDVFMYRGDTAFCSVECRYRQISIDEQQEKCRSGVRTQLVEFSISPCFVAAA